MKSKLNELTGLALLCSVVALPAGAQAGFALAAAKADPPPSDERQRPGNGEDLPQLAKESGKGQARSVIKCWQYGRLIVHEQNWLPGYGTLPGTAFRSGGPYQDLRLMQFGDTFCLYKQKSTP